MNASTEGSKHYSGPAKAFHWIVAAIVLAQLILAQLANSAEQDGNTLERLALLANHKSLGLTALVVIVLRIAWRLTHRPPALPPNMNRMQRIASGASHNGLYLLMVAMPVTGLVMSAASAYGLSWFNLFEVPRIMAPNDGLSDAAKTAHVVLGYAFVGLIAVHVAAALYHLIYVKDDIVKRMSSLLSIGLFALILGALTLALTPSSTHSGASRATLQASPKSVNEAQTPKQTAGTERWTIDYEQSFVRFTAEQAGAAFDGEWPTWRADITFSEQPLIVTIDVEIETDNADTRDEERDTTLKDSDWFNAAEFPVARFTLDNASRLADGRYTGTSFLTIKDKTTPIEFVFAIEKTGGQYTLTGTSRLDRLALGVGTGEWLDTSWVGQYVEVEVQVTGR